ncbi:MAG: T9SS type A sorting domain-containing protein [Flavobacteriaceae bacterium]|uniref:T9SS type A sorting domain-containing protein n=1 Tax=Flavobacterium kayseriense TaxID=2764714 RepID=A0ABR7J5T4_9FLAO|nr:alpha-amylase family glycosyl hydrolase [Flavobacterium kayseriense]MBC5840899.1 T9SS type A sorting domain-containing protein [Flavobacterium kayseriense]MBC5846432.1 T9SS type A sorting domain-containing protein [Flavobacterium kayseriense]MBX9886365.1 T9SS type A sorting domain-containing protein [Flavobacteriaceae bacterium]
MKKIILLYLFLFSIVVSAQQQTVTYSINPPTFEETTSITITINGSSVNEAAWGVSGNALYMWAWSFDINDANIVDCPTNGAWTASSETNRFTYNVASDTYTKTITPSTFYNRTNLGRIGFLVKAKDGTGDKKSQDILAEVGSFQVSLSSPVENSATILASGGSLTIAATNSGGSASYNLKANGVSINTNASTASYSFTHTAIQGNQNYELEVTQGALTIIKKFSVIANPGTITAAMPAGLVDGINYNSTDPTKASLVLDAPLKDFIYVAGSFNNWQPTNSYAMKKDPTTGKFWLELIGLVSGVNYSYQYWVGDATPIANSPALVKTADPYSTLVLSPYDDPFIPAASYPNMPVYPAGQEREVTVLQTGQAPYVWSAATTNFVKPEKEKLVVYELLVRDFDANRSYQDLINKIDYFKNLKINAIELLPVMEFEGNESWGYNTSFHMALDKFYGPSNKLKEFIDLCHQNGIAVILDVALNHAFGRNPMVRMWMNDPDGDGFGTPTTENPYFNTTARHSYNVGEDFNHTKALTKNYVKRVVKQWIEEYKIDGLRWDLTKGFTQNCSSSDDGCTNSYQQDRVDVLKEYADYSWSLDPTHYAIFEHLGSDQEEQQWANYRVAETPSKGIMMWGKLTDNYNDLSMGYPANIARMTSTSRGFTANRLMGYAESHDEERLMYKNLQFGNTSNTSHNVKNLNIALSRMSALGAVSLLIPGPKMIWQFGELGWETSIFACNNGTVNTPNDAISGDCKLDTKPQPQWVNNWLGTTTRGAIYNDWAKMITMKQVEPVFSGTAVVTNSNSLSQNIKITNSNLVSTQLKDVLIIANFDVTTQNIATGFPYTGTWYNLMDNTAINVTNVNTPISLAAGDFRIYGNKTASLAIEDFENSKEVNLYPNPAPNGHFWISSPAKQVLIYNMLGQLVKEFKGDFDARHSYPIDGLTAGNYLVKIVGDDNKSATTKLIKQ